MAKKRTRKQQVEDGPVPLSEPVNAVLDAVQAEPPIVEAMDPEAEQREQERQALEQVEASRATRQAEEARQLSQQIAAAQIPGVTAAIAAEQPSSVMTPAAPEQHQENGHASAPQEVQQAAEQSAQKRLRPEIVITLGDDNLLRAGFASSKKSGDLKHYAWLFTEQKLPEDYRSELKEAGYSHGKEHVWWKNIGEDRWTGIKEERKFIEQLSNKIREGFGLQPMSVMGTGL